MLKTHQDFKNPIGFAGGLWTWTGYAPNQAFTLDATEAAMRSIYEHSVNTIFMTLWGDDGKDCSYFTMLPQMYAVAQMAKGTFDRAKIAGDFEKQYGYAFEEFMNLELPNITKEEPSHFHNPCKYLLFNDPFLGVYDFTVRKNQGERYAKAKDILVASINGRPYDYLFDVEAKLLDVLVLKANLGVRLRSAYQENNVKELRLIAEDDFPYIIQAVRKFAEAFRALWLMENKSFGLEVQEQRFGGLLYRLEVCSNRLKDYLDGKEVSIEELEEQSLEMWTGFSGEAAVMNSWKINVTTSVL